MYNLGEQGGILIQKIHCKGEYNYEKNKSVHVGCTRFLNDTFTDCLQR